VNNASVLNAIKRQWEEHVQSRGSMNKRPLSGQFWTIRANAIQNLPKEWRCDLPKTPKRLRKKLWDYVDCGYCELLSGKLNNQNARIIDKTN